MWIVAKDVRVGDFLATEEIVAYHFGRYRPLPGRGVIPIYGRWYVPDDA